MSVSAAIQRLIVDRLKAHAGVTALVAGRVYDRAPKGASFPYISLGPTDAVRVPGDCKALRDVTVQVDIWSNYQKGKVEAKRIADAVEDALHEYDAEPDVGALIEMRVDSVRVFEDQDPAVTHGVVTVTAQVEG